MLYYDTLKPLCIGDTNYLLLELPFTEKWNKEVFALIEKLTLRFDVIPMIAHAERYPASNIKNIEKLTELGCIIQLNSASIENKKYKKKMIKYMKRDLVAVLASDCHNVGIRAPKLSVAFARLELEMGKEYCQRLKQNSYDVIDGKDIR